MRHRIAGNRINMPEPQRRAAFRNLIEGVVLHEKIKTTVARAKAVQSELERVIATALRGHRESRAFLLDAVKDQSVADQLWSLAGEAHFSLDTQVLTNEERLVAQKVPLRDEIRERYMRELDDRKARLLQLFNNNTDEARAGLTAARKARAVEVHARQVVSRRINNKYVIAKLFDTNFYDRYADRNGGYTRITKIGRRAGDGAEIAQLELVVKAAE